MNQNIKSNEIMPIEYSANGKKITFIKPLVMAIVNITPDSFYDGGKYSSPKDILNDAGQKVAEGAAILDLGAASSRPGAADVSEEEEWQRLGAVLPILRREFPDTVLSVDTWRASIARRAAAEGADMINDIGGGRLDPEMFDTIAALDLPYVLMHIQGRPATMQLNPQYSDVVREVADELSQSAKHLQALGFQKIILDPGFGFGKTTEHNYQLLRQFHRFADLGFPVLAGLSRKGMINKVIGTNPVTALNGTTVANTIALLNGANLLRVHDVTEAIQAIQLVEFYKNA